MEQDTRTQILRAIGKVYEVSNNCKLKESFFIEIAEELQLLATYFNTTPINTHIATTPIRYQRISGNDTR